MQADLTLHYIGICAQFDARLIARLPANTPRVHLASIGQGCQQLVLYPLHTGSAIIYQLLLIYGLTIDLFYRFE
jgi:hypothetical protein